MSAYEAGESFVQTLIMNLETLLSSFKDILSSNNYDHFLQVLTAEVTQRFEKVVMKSQFNRVSIGLLLYWKNHKLISKYLKLGGLILDKEVRSLAGYITSGTYYSVRDQFARLTQIATILNFDQIDEINDYWGNFDGAITWRLTPSEIKNVLNLR